MALTTDEQAMRTALQELGAAQPDAPADRLTGVQRRHRRRRVVQSVGASLAIAALVAGGLTIAATLRPTHTRPQLTTSPALPWQLRWPERNDGSVDKQRVLFWLGQQGLEDLRHVRWLYAATAPGTINRWAIIEADFASSPSPNRVNALLTVVSRDGGDKWTVQMHAAPAVSTEVLGVADQNGHAVLALAAPGVDAAELVVVHREDGIDESAFPPLVDGASVVTSSAALQPGSTLVRTPGAPSTFLVLFDNDQQAVGAPLWWRTPPVRLHGDRAIAQSFGGGGGGFSNARSPAPGTLVLQVRCVGPTPLRLVVSTTNATEDVDVDRCDGVFHTYLGPRVVPGERIGVADHGDQGENTAVIDVSVRR